MILKVVRFTEFVEQDSVDDVSGKKDIADEDDVGGSIFAPLIPGAFVPCPTLLGSNATFTTQNY